MNRAEREGHNEHLPWQPYTGYRDKCFHDIQLIDGTVHRLVWPNADKWNSMWPDSEVAYIRESIDHPMDYTAEEMESITGRR